MDYQDYIKTELLILIPVLYFIGIGLKKSKLPEKLEIKEEQGIC